MSKSRMQRLKNKFEGKVAGLRKQLEEQRLSMRPALEKRVVEAEADYTNLAALLKANASDELLAVLAGKDNAFKAALSAMETAEEG